MSSREGSDTYRILRFKAGEAASRSLREGMDSPAELEHLLFSDFARESCNPVHIPLECLLPDPESSLPENNRGFHKKAHCIRP